MSVHGLLATGPSVKLREFQLLVCFWLNPHNQRGQTVYYSCMAEHLDAAKKAAEASDVTLQEIITTGTKNARRMKLGGGASATVSDCIEEYPVLHLASHRMKWERPHG